MTDLITRLRKWCISTDAVPASDLMDEAADVIEKGPLTADEQEAIEFYAKYGRHATHSNRLLALLKRLSPPAT